jgi:hypothetical protein
VLPFDRFPDVDTLLGPEMKSTGEVMGIGTDFGLAYAKAQLGAGQQLPLSGTVFISVGDDDKAAMLARGQAICRHGFRHSGHRRHLVPSGCQRHPGPTDQQSIPGTSPRSPMRSKTIASG